jgi:hypothetical protein
MAVVVAQAVTLLDTALQPAAQAEQLSGSLYSTVTLVGVEALVVQTLLDTLVEAHLALVVLVVLK